MPGVANVTPIQPKILRNPKKIMEMEIVNQLQVVPYHDPYFDFPLDDQFLMFDESPSLGFLEIPSIEETSSCGAFISESKVGFGDLDDTLWDPIILEMINEHNYDFMVNCEGDSLGNNGERIDEGKVLNSQISQGFGTEDHQMPNFTLSVPLVSYDCAFCHILREIIHVNGKHVRNLEMHGRVGVISHVVLDKYYFDPSSDNHEHQVFDFCNESIGGVKSFLVQYFEDCKREGYSMLQDPLSHFYQALCIGCNDFLQSSSMVSGDLQMNQQNLASQEAYESDGIKLFGGDDQMLHSQSEAENKETPFPRSFLATQRERTGKMKLKDFSVYFHLPIHEAARKMNVCPTVIKKKCREGGLSRWPYRKIKGIKRKISKKQEILETGTFEERACAAADIRILEQELENIFANFSC